MLNVIYHNFCFFNDEEPSKVGSLRVLTSKWQILELYKAFFHTNRIKPDLQY